MDDQKSVVRLQTSYWADGRGVYQKRSLLILKKKSGPLNFMACEVADIGAVSFFKHLTNINLCKDGLYTVEICNAHTDWETGMIDDYDYKLVEYQE